jgi:hypothetical protein
MNRGFLLRLWILALPVFSQTLYGEDSIPEWTMLPGAKIFPRFTADALAHGISLARVTDNRDWIGTIGGAVAVSEVRWPRVSVQAGVAVTTFNRMIKTPGHITVNTIDYKVDFPLDLRLSQWAFRLGLGHISSHFADDGIEILGQHSIQSAKDYMNAGAAYDIPVIRGYVYASAYYNYHVLPYPDKKWIWEWGLDAANTPLAGWAELYVAVDLKVKQENDWGSTQSYECGVRLFARGPYALRVAYTFRTGFEERGQLFDRRVVANLLSLHLDF